MGVDLLVNLALADILPAPVVLPYEQARTVDPARLIAIWCEAAPGTTLHQRIVASRPTARELRRPLAIWTGSREFDFAVTGVLDGQDQFWMHCQTTPQEPLHVLHEAYDDVLRFCPLARVVLVVEPMAGRAEEPEAERAHLRVCRELARHYADVIGLVRLGETTLDGLPGPPLVVEVIPLPSAGWGPDDPTPADQ